MYRRTTALAALLTLLVVAACADAERSPADGDGSPGEGSTEGTSFPTRSIELQVPFPAGGPTDTEARIVARAAEEELGESIVIRNVGGAGGTVAFNNVPGFRTDGHQITMYNLPHIVSNPIVRDVQFSPDDFEWIAHGSQDPTAFFVRDESDIEDLDDLIERALERPDSVTVATAGMWLAHHLAVLSLEEQTDIELRVQPFEGSAPANQAVLGGHVDLISGNVSDVLRSGEKQFRVLAVAAEERSEFLPEAPTFKEEGYDILMSSDRGFAAPAGVDEDALAVLREAFAAALQSDGVQEELREVGSAPLVLTDPDEIQALVNETESTVERLLEGFEGAAEDEDENG